MPRAKVIAIAGAVALAPLSAASATTINVNILNNSNALASVSNPGYGLWGQGTEVWNLAGASPSTGLVDSTGASTTVGYSLTNFGSNGGNTNWGVDAMTQYGKYGPNDNVTIGTATISGLDPNASYDLLFYHAKNNTNEIETANGMNPTQFTGSTTTTGGATYIDAYNGITNSNFWYFSGITPDAQGNIVVNASGPNYETVVGFQLQTVPEPTSLSLLGLGGLGVLKRRRRSSL